MINVQHAGQSYIHPDLTLNIVLLVPSFKFNLLSVHKLCSQFNSLLTFSATSCFLQGPSLRRPLDPGKVKDGLYLLQTFHPMSGTHLQTNQTISFPVNNCHQSVCTLFSNSEFSCGTLWHVRLGHMPISSMKHISVLPQNAFVSNPHPCSICPLARQHKLPFPKSTSSTSHIFELIHIDTWGPYKTTTYDGFKYFLTIVDNFSRGTWTYLLSNNDNAFTILKSFIAMVKDNLTPTLKSFDLIMP